MPHLNTRKGHMLVNWAYVERDTIIHRLDPRARIIFMLCALVALGFVPGGDSGAGVWDIRLVLIFLAISFLQIFLARLTWRQTRRFWIVISIVAVMLSLITLLTGRGAVGTYDISAQHTLWEPSLNILGLQLAFRLTSERFVFLITQIMRIMTFAALSVTIPYTINPSLYGITFKGLGLSDKIAYAMDMAFRFIPSLGRDFQITMDAQRARGFELEAGEGVSLIQRVRNFAPLLIPLTIGAVIGGEEITDAMDLRAFGIGKRTWLPQLKYRAVDRIYIALGLLILAGTIVIKVAGYGGFWMPQFLLN
jgi:energy-coupling factor transport system permease protein